MYGRLFNIRRKIVFLLMISIIIPAFNRAHVICKTLDSIKNQTFTDWECIIVDDMSEDSTWNTIQTYIKSDKRYSLIKNSRTKGAQGARNTGLLKAKGEWIVFFDSDDTMHSDLLEKLYKKLLSGNADVCGSFLNLVDQNGNMLGAYRWKGYGRIHHNIMNGRSYFCNDSTIMRREQLLVIGMLDEQCPSYQEWDTHIRLSKIATYTTVEEELVDYYQGALDTISSSIIKDIRGTLYILKKYEKEWILTFPVTYFRKLYGVYSKLQAVEDKNKYNELHRIYLNKSFKPFRLIVQMLFRFRHNLRKTISR